MLKILYLYVFPFRRTWLSNIFKMDTMAAILDFECQSQNICEDFKSMTICTWKVTINQIFNMAINFGSHFGLVSITFFIHFPPHIIKSGIIMEKIVQMTRHLINSYLLPSRAKGTKNNTKKEEEMLCQQVIIKNILIDNAWNFCININTVL